MSNIDKSIPKHIGIIMDGNGRWAEKRNKSRSYGHQCGADALDDVINGCLIKGVKYLTLYTFSTENKKRPKEEVDALMNLVFVTAHKKIQLLQDNKVRIKVIGDLSKLPFMVSDCFNWCINETKDNDALDLFVAMNYSSRDEITRAVKKIAKEAKNDMLNIDDIDENTISQYLDTKNVPDPDLIIRTGGEYRLSNFMLWQASYSELIFMDVLWPDFTKEDLFKAIDEYMYRDRRFGEISNK